MTTLMKKFRLMTTSLISMTLQVRTAGKDTCRVGVDPWTLMMSTDMMNEITPHIEVATR